MEEATKQPTDAGMLALAEQLKAPLFHITQLAELEDFDQRTEVVRTLSAQALRTIDALTFAHTQTALELEPVSVGAVLYDVAQSLEPMARRYQIDIEIGQRGNRVPVMTHRVGLKTLLEQAGDVLVQLLTNDVRTGRQRLLIACHPTPGGQIAGVFYSGVALSQANLNTVRKLYGRAAQPAPSLALSGGASLVIADRLAAQLRSVLKVYQHASLKGLGASFPLSKQLQLVP